MLQRKLNEYLGYILFPIIIISIFIFSDNIYTNSITNIVILAYIINAFIFCKFRFYYNKVILYNLCFCIYGLLGVFYAYSSTVVFNKFITITLLFIFSLSIISFIRKSNSLQIYLFLYYLSILTICIILLFKNGFTYFLRGLMNGERMGGELGNNVNSIGLIFGTGTIFGIYFILFKKKWLLLLPTSGLVFFALSTGSRKVIIQIGFGILCLIYLYSFYSNKKLKVFKFIFYFLVTIVCVFLIFRLPYFQLILKRFQGGLNSITGKGVSNSSSDLRLAYSEYGIMFFLKKPILGYGLDNARFILGRLTSHYTYSHNNLIEILVNGGIIGFSLYFIPYFILFKRGINRIEKTNIYFILFITLIILQPFYVSYYDKMYWINMSMIIVSFFETE